jgi:hypothetical protein
VKHVLMLALMATAFAASAQEIEPAVTTSSSALTPNAPGANAPAADASAAGKAAADNAAADKAAAGKTGANKAAATGTPADSKGGAQGKANAKSTAHDQIQLDTTQITGSRELPNVMYVVPWKRPELGDLGGRPAKSLVDDALAPVDRDVFRRQNRYFTALQSDSAPRPTPPPAPTGSGVTPPGG